MCPGVVGADHPAHVGDAAQRGVHARRAPDVGGGVERFGGVHDDVGGSAGLLREPGREDLLGPLRRGLPVAEVGLEVAPDHLAEDRHGHDRQDPPGEHVAPVVVAPSGEPTEVTERARGTGAARLPRRRRGRCGSLRNIHH